MRKLSLWFCAACGLVGSLGDGRAAEPKLKPRHDPPDQLFRRAPMAEAARSVVVNLATNLHYAFDTDLARIHTVWQGNSLNLWGPPYSFSKSPFICDFNGKVLLSFPGISPWWSAKNALATRFRSIETVGGEVALAYDILSTRPIRALERLEGIAQDEAWRLLKTLAFPNGCKQPVSFLAFAEAGASAERIGSEIKIVSTNGAFVLGASNLIPGMSWTIENARVTYETVRLTEEQTEKGIEHKEFSGEEMRVYLSIPVLEQSFMVSLTFGHGSLPMPLPSSRTSDGTPVFSASGERRAPSGDDSYKIEYFPMPPEAELLITGMDWMPNGDLAVCTWIGEIFMIQNATGEVRNATYKRYARGLNEPLGLTVSKGEIFVVQKGELTRVTDSDKDGSADRFDCVNSSWGYSGNYHSYAFGPLLTPENDFLVFITGQRGLYELPYQGWALQISATGDHVEPFCSGLRVPHGIGYGPDRDIFVTDNQGNWIGACRLNHLQRGKFYGFPSSTPAPKAGHSAEEVEPPVLWFPRSLAPSASGFESIYDDRFGPFKGQMLIGDFQNSIVMRAFLEKVNGRWQGAVFPFAKGFLSGVNRLKMGPDGKLYVGGGKRTWSTAAPKEFSLDRVAFAGKDPFEVREVRATTDGFELLFTRPVDKTVASEAPNYLVKQFTYKYHQDYGSPEFDHSGKVGATEIPASQAQVSGDGLKVMLTLPGLRAGFVTSFQLAISSTEDEDLRSDIFYYTLGSVPSARSAQ